MFQIQRELLGKHSRKRIVWLPMTEHQILHFGVYGILLKGTQLLLVKKSKGPYLGLFDLPGGKIEHGESPEEALIREVQEETGILPLQWSLFRNLSSTSPYYKNGVHASFHHVGMIYTIDSHDASQFQSDICDQDVAGAKWIELGEIGSMTPLAKQVSLLLQPFLS